MKIVVTGPECSGKSTLAEALAQHFGVPFMQEPARAYLTPGARYQPSDLLRLGQQQLELETSAHHWPLILDTDLQTLCIWWQEKFGPLPEVLRNAYARQSMADGRIYLLCRPDLPWVHDPLRENPHDRDRLFALYRQDLVARELPFAQIDGTGPQRLERALAFLKAR